MTEENTLRQRFGSQRPFTVPDGYFEAFAPKMMSQLPAIEPLELPTAEEDLHRQHRRAAVWGMVRRYAVAVSIVGVVAGAAVWFLQPRDNIAASHFVSTSIKTPAAAAADENIEQMADYVMLDNQDIYSYLADY